MLFLDGFYSFTKNAQMLNTVAVISIVLSYALLCHTRNSKNSYHKSLNHWCPNDGPGATCGLWSISDWVTVKSKNTIECGTQEARLDFYGLLSFNTALFAVINVFAE